MESITEEEAARQKYEKEIAALKLEVQQLSEDLAKEKLKSLSLDK